MLTSAPRVAVGAFPVQIVSAVARVRIRMGIVRTTRLTRVATLRAAAGAVTLVLNGLQSSPTTGAFVVRVDRWQGDFVYTGLLEDLVQVGAVPFDHNLHIVELLADDIAVLQNFAAAGLEGLQGTVDGVLVCME